MNFPRINRHWIGVSAVALAIAALGFGANVTKRPAASLSEISSPAPAQTPDFLSLIKRIPPNAFGSAQPGSEDTKSMAGTSAEQGEAQAKDWTQEEWRLATAAVAASRKGGKQALSSEASSKIIWQPPQEIADK